MVGQSNPTVAVAAALDSTYRQQTDRVDSQGIEIGVTHICDCMGICRGFLGYRDGVDNGRDSEIASRRFEAGGVSGEPKGVIPVGSDDVKR